MAAAASLQELCSRVGRSPEGLPPLMERLGYVPFLAFLEFEHAEVRAGFVDGLVSAGVSRGDAEKVSLSLLVVFALTAGISTQWASKALGWLEGGFPIDKSVALALEDASSDKRLSQSDRHRALRLLKRWRREANAGA